MCLHIYVYECLVASVMSDSVAMWTVACQAPLSMGFSKQEYQSGLPCSSSGDLTDQGSNPCIMSPALTGRFFTTSATREAYIYIYIYKIVKLSFSPIIKFGGVITTKKCSI